MPTQTISTYTFKQLESTDSNDRTPADVIAHALADAEAIREQARAEGQAAGYAEGLERARTDTNSVLAGLADATRAVSESRDELVETLTGQAGELALLTAEHLIAGAIAVQPERIVDVVRGALRRMTDRHRVTVLVNPEDLEILSESVQMLQAELGGIEHLDVQADRRIARGGAVAQTVYGEIDTSVSAQLQTARELLAAALAGEADLDQPAGESGELVIGDGI